MFRFGLLLYAIVVTALTAYLFGLHVEHRYQTRLYKQQWDQEFKQYKVAIEAELETKAKYDALREQFNNWKERQREFKKRYHVWRTEYLKGKTTSLPEFDHLLVETK